MKKIISLFVISALFLASCWTATKYEDLPTEKQETISAQLQEKISSWISAIDMSAFTSEENLTEENIKKLTEQINSIVDNAISEVKQTEWDFDSTILEERLKRETKTTLVTE